MVIENHNIGVFIPNDTGRLFTDGDGFADLKEWPRTGELKNLNIEADSLIDMNQRSVPN